MGLKNVACTSQTTPKTNMQKTPIRKPHTVIQETPFPPKHSKSSPLGFLGKLFGTTVVSGSPSEQSPYSSAHQLSPVFSKKKKHRYSTPENYKQKSLVENCKQIKGLNQPEETVIDDKITFLKQTFSLEQPPSYTNDTTHTTEQNESKQNWSLVASERTDLPFSHSQHSKTESKDPEYRQSQGKINANLTQTNKCVNCPTKESDVCQIELQSLKKK